MSTIDTVNSMLDQYGISETTASTSDNSMGKDAFLNLLVTQMQYQDPLEPSTDTDFLAQMAQFSALEQMQNLNSSFSMSQASALIDKYVQGTTYIEASGETQEIVGIVDAVNLKDGVPYLLVGTQEIALEDVVTVISDFGSETIAMIEAINELEDKVSEIDEKLATVTGTSTEDDETTVEDDETTVEDETDDGTV